MTLFHHIAATKVRVHKGAISPNLRRLCSQAAEEDAAKRDTRALIIGQKEGCTR